MGAVDLEKAAPAAPPEPPPIPEPPKLIKQAYTATAFEIHAWGASGISYYFMYKEFAMIQLVFSMHYGVSPVVIGWALALPRLFDSLLDPLIGHLSDNTHTRWGRRRPYMVVSALLAAVVLVALYRLDPEWSKDYPISNIFGDGVESFFGRIFGTTTLNLQFLYLLGTVMLYYALFGIYELSRSALSYELSDDYSLRSKIVAIGTVWSTFPSLFGSLTYLFILHLADGTTWEPFSSFSQRYIPLWDGTEWHPFSSLANVSISFPNLHGAVNAARTVSVVFAVLIVISAILPAIFLKERFQRYNKKHVGIWIAIKATFKNKAFIVVLLLRLAEMLGQTVWGVLSMYVCIFCVFRGNKENYSQIMTFGGAILGFGFSLLVWPLAAPLTRKIGKRRGLIIGYGFGVLGAVITPFIYRPGWEWVIIGISLFFMPLGAFRGVFASSLMPDICDIDELESGERREGLYSAVSTFIIKLETSVCGLVAGYTLVWAGYNAEEVAKGIDPNQTVINNMLWMSFTPLIFFSVVALIISFYLPLTQERMAEVHAELERRREKQHLVDADKL